MKRWLALAALTTATSLGAQLIRDPVRQFAVAKEQQAQARQRLAALDAQAQAAQDAAEAARAAQAALAARIQLIEAEILAGEARLAGLRQEQRAQERRLAERRQPIARLLAALQTMARRPAVAALVQPGSLSDAVHVRAMLASAAPEIARRTAALRAEAKRARLLREREQALVASLRRKGAEAGAEQRRLAALEAEQRRRLRALAATAGQEAQRATLLAAQAGTLDRLVQSLGAEARLRDRLARLPGPIVRPNRITSALPIDATPELARFTYRLPVIGPVVRGFGEVQPSGTRSRGVTWAAKPGALVVAPAAGRVSFAGLFRGYGAIAIIDHGGGQVTLITGLSGHIARTGDTVAQGGPIGRAGLNGVTVELRRDGQAVDLSQFVA
jgi:murein hydrolase activator